MAALLALGLAFLTLSLSSATTLAAPTTQQVILVLPVQKTATHASIYTITNPSNMTATTEHSFLDHDADVIGGLIIHSFVDELAPFEIKVYDLSTIPEIPSDNIVDEVRIASNRPLLEVTDNCASATIQSITDGNWSTASTWFPNRVPNNTDVVLIQSAHRVVGGPQGSIRGLCNFGFLEGKSKQPFHIVATKFISNYGQIRGVDGHVGTPQGCGGRGSNLILEVFNGPIFNIGNIQAGHGGDDNQCGGAGGSTTVMGRNITNRGTICAGVGGDVLGTGQGRGGKGGNTLIMGKYGGPGFVINSGYACGGDGGDGNIGAIAPQKGGDGGDLKILSLPNVFLEGGAHFAGRGGRGTGGGTNGKDGQLIIEPNTISLAGDGTQLSGGDIMIFGGNDWILDLSDMNSTAISATGNITLAVGSSGLIDLRGNSGQVLQAGGQVLLASDVISLDPGLALSDVVGANVVTTPGQILYDVSLIGPGLVTGSPRLTLPISLMVLNGGPVQDTYTLSRSDSAGWQLGPLPSPLTIEGLDLSDVTLNIIPPSTVISGDTNIITITATSLANPKLVAVEQLEIVVETNAISTNKIYLPLIFKN